MQLVNNFIFSQWAFGDIFFLFLNILVLILGIFYIKKNTNISNKDIFLTLLCFFLMTIFSFSNQLEGIIISLNLVKGSLPSIFITRSLRGFGLAFLINTINFFFSQYWPKKFFNILYAFNILFSANISSIFTGICAKSLFIYGPNSYILEIKEIILYLSAAAMFLFKYFIENTFMYSNINEYFI